MKRVIFTIATALLVSLYSALPAAAAGFGLVATTGNNTIDWTSDWVVNSFSTDAEHSGFGIVFDTNVAKERMFNYRFEFTKAEATFKNFTAAGLAMEVDGFAMNHTFGFGTQLSPMLRFWVGPEIRMTWMDGALTNDPQADLDVFGFGVGAAIGLNINFPGQLTLALKGGYSLMNYVGEGDSPVTHNWTDYDGDEDHAYVTFALIIRSLGDR
ncbi:MAG: hypothetical protein A2X56_07080 [Nitrospirae bacterium GWC2_57_13]|jgi:hypothetical protein|nr:MAG: hypothetical protein A2X56_07080 [Nitrospirae bacterium GWC2_57_13]OGW43646.1 MAG: hypothetical protein A2X57_00575 [Nitrospirae bacterium GWD2_57_8]